MDPMYKIYTANSHRTHALAHALQVFVEVFILEYAFDTFTFGNSYEFRDVIDLSLRCTLERTVSY